MNCRDGLFCTLLVQNDLQETEPRTYSMKQKENVPPINITVEMVSLIYSLPSSSMGTVLEQQLD